MPYKSSTLKLSERQDRRVKLTSDMKAQIIKKYETGLYSLNSLAKEYGVSKKLILITVNPQGKEKSDAHIKEHWKDYSNREQLTKATRETRRYKQQLYLKGELKDNAKS